MALWFGANTTFAAMVERAAQESVWIRWFGISTQTLGICESGGESCALLPSTNAEVDSPDAFITTHIIVCTLDV